MKKRIGINGFGRIGRTVLRTLIKYHEGEFDIVGINGLSSAEELAHLFEFDSTYGRFEGTVEVREGNLIINGDEIRMFQEKDPVNIPWGEVNADVVLECTGVFTNREGMQKHITAGAKRVLLSAPAKKSEDVDITMVLGVNDNEYDASKHFIISNASCTTNCLAPVAKVLEEEFGIVKGLMTTVHAYTGDQRLLDSTHKDMRRARSAGVSMVPTTTGAAKAVSLVLPALKGKLNGFSLRVPTQTVSVVDLTVQLAKSVTAVEVNEALQKASEGSAKGFLGFEKKPLVSIDFKGDSRSAIIDASSTIDMGDGFVKVLAWYDNEWGYSARLADMALKIS